ncbi:hypothetical protein C0Q70_02203 [Pomacea canaliculata]|uniref:DEAD-box helicase OB fold domain-containing protein n=1 Tax=Pomacea canaliculata TaxID=400727 RepID=A0A2T7Q1L1_POMCA|nr:hypothetical protein C0Q70_02203 [Pomacea canaliculata]
MGLYPNVCFHQEKHKVLTQESHALIHKSSVNCSSFEILFPSPFFIFGEKNHRAVSAKQMTMVSPLQLLLFAHDQYHGRSRWCVLDNWQAGNYHGRPAKISRMDFDGSFQSRGGHGLGRSSRGRKRRLWWPKQWQEASSAAEEVILLELAEEVPSAAEEVILLELAEEVPSAAEEVILLE